MTASQVSKIYYYNYFKNWNPQENFYYCVEKTGFETNDQRSEGTYSKYASLDDAIDGFHFYFMYLKFGFGRTTSDAAIDVRRGAMSRDQALELIKL